MVNYRNCLLEYYNQLRSFYLSHSAVDQSTAELSFRPYLDTFLSNVANQIDSSIQHVFEPRSQGKYGRPDWVFIDSVSMGIYGYVEAKGFSPNTHINPDDHREQINKYLLLGNPVILTDGIEFVLFRPDGSSQKTELFPKPLNWDNFHCNLETLSIFQEFFSAIGYRSITETLLIKELSERARLLSSELVELVKLEEDEAENSVELETIRTLKRLWDTAASNLDASLSNDKTFAGFVAQILAFGLLYAHRLLCNKNFSPKELFKHLHFFWTNERYSNLSCNVEPFIHLFNALSSELDSQFSRIGVWYDNTRRLLCFIKISNASEEKPNFHQLYEEFLTSYDQSVRIDFGAWYTPTLLSNFLAQLVDFKIKVNSDLRKVSHLPFHVIDPCCGTGTFMESVVKYMDLPDGSYLSGFEILPVPYALANYRISLLNTINGVVASVRLTNTLGNNTLEEPEFDTDNLDAVGLFFANEQIASYRLSQPPLTIIIGNPPCSDSATTNAGSILNNLMDDFRPPKRTSRQNTQMQLSNEWVKFLRWSLYKSIKSKPSLVAMILPSAFAENVSFKYARKYLIEHANEISVIEFDSDNRVVSSNQNIFNTLQGRLLLVATFCEEAHKEYIQYCDIRSLSKTEKQAFFSKPITSLTWEIVPLSNNFILRPEREYDVNLYSCFVPIHEDSDGNIGIFLRHCSGMKLAPTHLLVHVSQGQLKRRSKFISNVEHTYEIIKDRWYSGQAKPPSKTKITESVKQALAIPNQDYRLYSYRPFLTAYVNLTEELINALGTTSGGGMRSRPEVKAAFSDSNVFGFAMAPAPAEISTSVQKFCSFCWYIPDNDLSTRGNAHVFCNRFPEYKKKKAWNDTPISNISPQLLSVIQNSTGLDRTFVENEIVFYAYAILSSPLFLEQFNGILHKLAGSIPSIPISADRELFRQTVEAGRRLALLEKEDYVFSDYEIKNTISISLDEIDMDFELKSYSINMDGVIVLSNGISNITIEVPQPILNFSISGYNVIREWLKYHSFSYYRKKLSAEDWNSFENLIKRISLYIDMNDQLDELVSKILDNELITPEILRF